MSTSFPSLSIAPEQVTSTPLDNAVKSRPENGKVIARKRVTRDLWRFEVSYKNMTTADLNLLKHPTTGLWASVGTYGIFSWTYDGSTYDVRFEEPIRAVGKASRGSSVSFTLLST